MGRIATYITVGSKLGSSQSSNRCLSKSALMSVFPKVDTSKLTKYANNQLVELENVMPVVNLEWLVGVEQIAPYRHSLFDWEHSTGGPGGSYSIMDQEEVEGQNTYQIRLETNTGVCPVLTNYKWVPTGDSTVKSVSITDECPAFLVSVQLGTLLVGQMIPIQILLYFSSGFTSGLMITFKKRR